MIWNPLTECRTALWVALGGVAIAISATFFPVTSDYWDNQDDAAQIALLDDNRVQAAVAFGFEGLGLMTIGIGLFMLGRAIKRAEVDGTPRRGSAARVAACAGLVAAVGGLSRSLHAIFATPEFYVDSTVDAVVTVVAGIGLLLAMAIVGVLSWSAPPPKWTAIVIFVGGPLGFLPEISYLAFGIFAVANLFVLRPATEPASPATARVP